MVSAAGSIEKGRRVAHSIAAAVLASVAFAAIVLYRFPPAVYSFYPLCPVHAYLHLECPGCGATRALAALVHGHLMEAMEWNALMIGLVLPLAAGYGVASYTRALRCDLFRWPKPPMPAMYAGIGLMMAFTVIRNL